MKFYSILTLIIIPTIIACKKAKSEVPKTPKVELNFNFDELPIDKEISNKKHVIDLEKLFTKTEIDELEAYLADLQKEKNIKISFISLPSKEKLKKEWQVTSSLMHDGMIITLSKSMKSINVAFDKNTNEIVIKKIKDSIIKQTVLPKVIEGNYYGGIKKGLIEIIDNLEI